MGITNPPLALSGHAWQLRAEPLCSAKRGKDKGVRGPLPHGGWGVRLLDKMMILQGVKLTIQPLGVWYMNRPKKAQNGGVWCFPLYTPAWL